MSEWKEYKLGDIIKIKHGFAFKGKFFTEGPSPNILLTPGNFAIGGGFKGDKLKFYDGPIPNDYILQPYDVLVTMTDLSKKADTLGYSAKVPLNKERRYLHNQRLGLVSLKDKSFDKEFIYWLLRTKQYQRYIAGSASGSTVKHTSPKKIYTYKFKAPESLPTQRKIATLLSAYDDLIENNLRRIQLLEELAQRTYEEWFVRLRFPGHETTPVDGETGLPVGWREVKLSEIAGTNETTIKKNFNGFIEYIDISSVSTGRIDNTTFYDINEAPSRARRIVKHGDIIWSTVRPNRKSYSVIWNPNKNLVASTGFCVISPQKIPSSYLYQCLATEQFVSYLTNLASGAAYPAVKPPVFDNHEITVPTEEVLSEFDIFASSCIDLIHNLLNQNQLLREARDILLPRLMTGMIDVDALEFETLSPTTS